jgi:putative ABC transport system ATP-binding protein
MKNLVEITKLKFRYGPDRPWILDLDRFEMREREKVFLLGPSGSGKSTLLEILSGVLAPTEGDVKVRDVSLPSLSAAERDHFRGTYLGYVFQSFNLIPYLSIRENIELPLLLNPARRARLKSDSDREVEMLANQLGLGGFLERKVTELSVGQQQRVAAARALIGSPSLILADEPTSALDADHRQKFIELLFESATESGAGILFVSHDRSLQGLFDRVVSLADVNRVPR